MTFTDAELLAPARNWDPADFPEDIARLRAMVYVVLDRLEPNHPGYEQAADAVDSLCARLALLRRWGSVVVAGHVLPPPTV